ncbi:Transcription factor MYB1R1 [Apostasia shenzhenica]|uniref:Transcription factor MYB1R1 n=1 Tax=Apostasia shenzhenica TaxID=1088818 RepID=A0A2I0B6I7_9ASPA|nr:Transcription factor MYB1R1 [Apostasia shenzhenica]
MTRRCSHCSSNRESSRSCSGSSGVKLFGVRIVEGVRAMKKSASMGSLSSAAACYTGSPTQSCSMSSDPARDHADGPSGYASDDLGHASCSPNCRNERKKGNPWSEEEHRMFLLGLQTLGKGDWRGISRNFVVTRTPTQVASHAQKYFIRQTNSSRRKRRSSLFDMVPELPRDQVPVVEEQLMLHSRSNESANANSLYASLHLGNALEPQHTDAAMRRPVPLPEPELKENILCSNAPSAVVPTYYPTLVPLAFPFWPPNLPPPINEEEAGEIHEVFKPTPVLPKDLVNADQLADMSNLSIRDGAGGHMVPSALSIKLHETSSSRQSAFHTNPSFSRPDLSQGSNNAIHAL